jgi:hypothetical protein
MYSELISQFLDPTLYSVHNESDASLQISTVCGARQQGHFARPQFFIALKLIAAAQNGLPVMLESLNSGRDLPLPKFAMQVPPEVGKCMHNI